MLRLIPTERATVTARARVEIITTRSLWRRIKEHSTQIHKHQWRIEENFLIGNNSLGLWWMWATTRWVATFLQLNVPANGLDYCTGLLEWLFGDNFNHKMYFFPSLISSTVHKAEGMYCEANSKNMHSMQDEIFKIDSINQVSSKRRQDHFAKLQVPAPIFQISRLHFLIIMERNTLHVAS